MWFPVHCRQYCKLPWEADAGNLSTGLRKASIQGKASRLMSSKRMHLQVARWSLWLWVLRPSGKGCGKPGHTAVSPGSSGWSWEMVVTAVLTFAVSVVINLDFGSSEAGVSMQLTVVEVGLAVAAAHRPLVRFALLKQTRAGGLCSQGASARIRARTHAHVQLVGTPW